jgi:hypothetical protein
MTDKTKGGKPASSTGTQTAGPGTFGSAPADGKAKPKPTKSK